MAVMPLEVRTGQANLFSKRIRIRKSGLMEQMRRSMAFTVAFFLLVTGASHIAQVVNRPVSSALIYVIGVMIIGAARGRRSGLTAGLTASLIYSALLRNPALDFHEYPLDYYVPLIAFNVTALLSGNLAGLLRDRAELAEESRNRLGLLLGLSSELQKAVRVEGVARALKSTLSARAIREQILPYLELRLSSGDTGGLRKLIDIVRIESSGHTVSASQFEVENVDLQALADLLVIAVERCELLDRQAEGEALKRSEELKTALLSSLSHDLRTPIAAISASATSLARFGETLDRQVRVDLLGTIQDQCTRLDRFTAKLLSFGRLQGGVIARELEPSDVVDLLGNALASARLAGPVHPLRKELPSVPVMVLANPAMLEQVFFNIIENAFAYNEAGSDILIKVEPEGDRATIIIRDYGRGVSESEMPNIFDPFFRSVNSRSTNGQGLGLFIAKGFVEAFGGEISARSPHAEGQGLEIAISLPLTQIAMQEEMDA